MTHQSAHSSKHRQRGEAVAAVLFILALLGFALCGRHFASPRAALEQLAAQAKGDWAVTLSVGPTTLTIDRDDATVRITSARPGYLVLLQAGTDGKSLDVVFPNALDQDNRVDAGATELPRPQWRLAAHGPAGEGALLAIVTAEKVDAEALRAGLSVGQAAALAVPYGAALAAWSETTAK